MQPYGWSRVLLSLAALAALGCVGCAGASFGAFRVVSDPPGAFVFVGNTARSYGQTPTKVQVRSSKTCYTVHVRLEKSGYQSEKRSFEVCPQKSREAAVSNPASIAVVLQRAGAAAGQGRVPRQQQQQQQQQTVIVGGTGAQGASRATEEQGSLSVFATPNGAEVYLDGSYVGSAPVTLKLRDGQYLLEVRKAGYRSFEKQVRVLAASQASVRAELEKQ